MAKINILPSKVYNRIAAGEVIERPCSVVKELIENAIDAGATEIEIFIENGGKDYIKVVDNGCGIEYDDLQSVFMPHATSKISKAEDLDSVLTLGFRGEAVASIASVSKMTITSKVQGGKCYRLTSEDGVLGPIEETVGSVGTEVCVETLFYSAPVRLKFLKTDKGEEAEITNFISRFILNRPDISFTYYANGKKVLQSFGGGLEEALISVYGASTLRECIQIDATKHGVRVHGYIGNQNFYKGNKSYQSVFLNGRYIINGTISSAVSNAYSSYLMKRQYPFYVLNVEVPREIVDVNVHPNKADVRFADNQIIYGCIYSILSAVLDGHTKALEYVVEDKKTSLSANEPLKEETSSIKDIQQRIIETTTEKEEKSVKSTEKTLENKQANVFGFANFTYEEAQREIEKCAPAFKVRKNGEDVPFGEATKNIKGFMPMSEAPEYVPDFSPQYKKVERPNLYAAEKLHKQFPELHFKRVGSYVGEQTNIKNDDKDYFKENQLLLRAQDQKPGQRVNVHACRFVGKLFNTYLMYEYEKEVYIIDQHAAHERLIYDKLKEGMSNRTIMQQPMLVPFEMVTNAYEANFMRERLDDIREMGFEISEVRENVFGVSAIPTDLQEIDLASFINDILGYINEYRKIKLVDIIKDKLATAACKAAVKAGRDLTEEEIKELFILMDGELGLKCPHGRPVVVTMTKLQLEKMFKRKL